MQGKKMITVIATLLAIITLGSFSATANTDPPPSPVKLIFIHHSTGGNWLADANSDQPYGLLGTTLMNNNYYVSATNYGWGPNSIGDRTDIPDWPDWFTGPGSSVILPALFSETRQNIDGYGSWSRLSTDPGGENTIIMFKSCFPNSDLFGDPDDPAASTINDQYTVANAKAVYNNILTYFATAQDKLFIVVTAPPQREQAYGPDYQTAAQRAANARAFNNWLVNDWLSGYAHNNVAVFDYYNVLSGADNHHRITNGEIEHLTSDLNNFAYYPSGDSHPSSTGHQKATTEFVPLLNYYYNTWQSSSDTGEDGTTDGGEVVSSNLWLKAVLNTSAGIYTLIWKEVGTDTTASGDKVVSGYFYADPTEFAYGSQYNPEVFVKIYIAASGWCNIAFNHVTVDDVDVYSAHNYGTDYDQYGTATLNSRLVEHSYTGVSVQ